MLPIPIFQPWRVLWETDGQLRLATEQADLFASRRNQGRQRVPDFEWDQSTVNLLQQFASLCRQLESEPQSMNPRLCHQVADCLTELRSVIRSALWPRWLELEGLLAEASATGSLLIGALALRTQIEELSVYQALSQYIDSDWPNEVACTPELFSDLRQLSLFIKGRILPRCRRLTSEELMATNSAPELEMVGAPRLREVYNTLGDYVHPNYGHHQLFVQPDSAQAAEIICRAFIIVYEEFLRFPWANEPAEDDVEELHSRPESDEGFFTIQKVISDWENDTPPELKQALMTAGEYLLHFEGSQNRRIHIASLGTLDDGLADALLTLARRLDPASTSHTIESIMSGGTSVKWPVPLNSPGARFNWAIIVRDSARLDTLANQLRGEIGLPHEPPYADWFGLVKHAVSLTVTVTEFKVHTLTVHAMRLLARRNGLGAALCIRSIFEMHAMLMDLGSRFKREWDQAHSDVRNGKDPAPALKRLDVYVARFLAGAKGTQESPTEWFARWNRSKPEFYNIMDAIRNADLQLHYGLLSKMVHGTTYRGGDLLGRGSLAVIESLLKQMMVYLGHLASTEKMLDRSAKAILVADGLLRAPAARADSLDGLNKGLRDESLPDKIKLRRDIFGSGTEADPYRFRYALRYHDAFYAWIKQEGITMASRCFWSSGTHSGDQVETLDGRMLYFQNDSPL